MERENMNEIISLEKSVREIAENLSSRIKGICDEILTHESLNNNRLIFLTEDLEVFSEALSILRENGYEVQRLNELNNIYASLEESLESEDFFLFREVLLFELLPVIDEWKLTS